MDRGAWPNTVHGVAKNRIQLKHAQKNHSYIPLPEASKQTRPNSYLEDKLVKSFSVRLLASPWTTRLRHPWDFPGKNTGVGCHFLLQGIFPTQGLNLGLLHCRQTLYHLSHQGSKLKPTRSFSSLVSLI